MRQFKKNLEVHHVHYSLFIFGIAMLLMILAQIPTPEYLNPAGCLFAMIWIASGVYTFMGFLFSIP